MNITKTGLMKANGSGIGENIMPNSQTAQVKVYNVPTYTHETNVLVPEWGAIDARRFYGSGGTATSNIIGTIYAGRTSENGTKYTYSIWMKNSHTSNKVRISANTGGNASVWLTPGEQARLYCTGTGNGSQNVQFNFRTETTGDEFDFTYWRPKVEIGTVVTPWTPNPDEAIYSGDGAALFESTAPAKFGGGTSKGIALSSTNSFLQKWRVA